MSLYLSLLGLSLVMPSEIAFDQEEGDDDCDHLSHMVQRSDLDLVEEVVALYCLLASELLAKDEEADEAFHPMAMVAGWLCPRKCIFHPKFFSISMPSQYYFVHLRSLKCGGATLS